MIISNNVRVGDYAIIVTGLLMNTEGFNSVDLEFLNKIQGGLVWRGLDLASPANLFQFNRSLHRRVEGDKQEMAGKDKDRFYTEPTEWRAGLAGTGSIMANLIGH